MRRNKLLLLLALLMTAATGTWAQNYLYLEVDPSDNTSATLKYGDPEGKPYYDGSSAQFWNNLGSPSVKITVKTITVDATSCASYGGNTFKSLFNGFSALTTITGLGTINAEEVTDMTLMFNLCSALTSVDFSGLNTGKVTTMDRLFKSCSSLTSVNFSGLNMSSLNVMKNLFEGCTSLQTLDLSGFSTSSVTDMSKMFYGCGGLTTLTFGSDFNTASVTSMVGMFQECSSLQSLDLSGFSTSSVTDMSYMFSGCSSLQTLDLSGLNTEKVTKMMNMFYGCSGLGTLDLSGFNTASVTNMSYMFYGCSGLGTLDLSGFNTSSVTNMSNMFRGCAGLQTLDLSGFTTSSVTSMSYMFSACTGLKSVNFSGLNTSGVTTMTYMFQGCTALQTLDLSDLNTSSVTDMRNMFHNCTGLQTLDISSFNTGNVTKMGSMFNGCSQLTAIFVGAGWGVASSANSMFTNCTSLPNWDETSNGTHANTGADGYLNKVKVTANEGETGEFWATYYNEYKHLIAPTGTQVFKVALSGTTLAMNEITDRIVTKGEGVVLKGTSNSIILEVNATASDDNYSGNSLQGTMTNINTTGANNYYVLNNGSQGVGFYKLASGNTLEVNNAYLSYDGGGESDFFSIGGGSDPAEPSTYTVTMKEGAVDAENWTITPTEATTTGVAEGTPVTLQYNGRLKVKSVKATAQQ